MQNNNRDSMNQGNRDVNNQSSTGQRTEGNWRQFRGKLREKWGDLRDDDLDRVQGKRGQLVGHIQERTGRQRQEIERDVDTISRDSGYSFNR